jgi:uncharacterized protein
MNYRASASAFVVLSILAVPALADYAAGIKAYQKKDYVTALKEWEPLARQGNPDALFRLGAMYAAGEGVQQDNKKAAQYYRWAAQQGHALAQTDLATLLYDGKGMPRNYAEAFQWYALAANQGNSQAQLNLGVMYGVGEGTNANVVTAYMWAILAAAGGEARAQGLQTSLAKQMQPAQIAAARELANAFKPTAPTPVKH